MKIDLLSLKFMQLVVFGLVLIIHRLYAKILTKHSPLDASANAYLQDAGGFVKTIERMLKDGAGNGDSPGIQQEV